MEPAFFAGINKVDTEYILCLDDDTILPEGYIEKALGILKNPRIVAVAIDYEIPQGHLAFGTSIWRTAELKRLYDYEPKDSECECVHMWNKVRGKLTTLPMVAFHIK